MSSGDLAPASEPASRFDPETRPVSRDECPVIVLKFGSSVLRSADDLPDVVTEIYRKVREGVRVVAVVSALGDATDRLFAEAEQHGCPHDNPHGPAYVSLGEQATVALLAMACDRAGLSVRGLTPHELQLTAHGDPFDAQPVALAQRLLDLARAGDSDVLIVPGFVAIDDEDRIVLLGRGGSDLTAVYLAHCLGAPVRLIKDVDGVYDRDPHEDRGALRFGMVSWEEARSVAGVLVQPKALEFAERNGLELQVSALGRTSATWIGRASARPRRLRVALAGCGVVGGGLLQRLSRHPDEFEVTAVLVRDAGKTRDVAVPQGLLTTGPEVLLESRPDVLVDVLSCGIAGATLTARALSAGITVVSANKQAVALMLPTFEPSARGESAQLFYSAAVGGGAPLIEAVRRARAAGEIAVVEGVLNGTVNFILERLARGGDFGEAVAAAQAAGLAEADPSADLSGEDAAAKLRILAHEAFGRGWEGEALSCTALTVRVAEAARREPHRQVSRVEIVDGRLTASIDIVPCSQGPLPAVRSDRNMIRVERADGAVIAAQGRGAGRWPTVESVFADLIDIWRLGAPAPEPRT